MKRILILLVLCVPAAIASAQYRFGRGYGYGGAYPYAPIGMATSGYQAQAEGMADLITARGQYEQDHAAAVAAMDAEHQLQIQRRMQQRQAYYAMQKQKAAEIRQWNGETREALQRSQSEMLPKPLSSSQIDLATGEIKWPQLLQTAQFDAAKQNIDQLFQQWAAANKSGQPFDVQPIVQAITKMRDQLISIISTVDTMTYLSARGFLDSLEMTVRRPNAG